MKVVAIQGSPRKRGNTDVILDRVLAAVRKKGHRSLGKVYAAKLKIAGCSECFACQKNDNEPGCAIQDDMQTVYDKLLKADLVILATPVFCWGPTAQIKAVMDRLYATFKFKDDSYVSMLEGKQFALIVTAAGTKEEGAVLCEQAHNALMKFMRAKDGGTFLAPLLKDPATTRKDEKLMKRVDAFAARLVKG